MRLLQVSEGHWINLEHVREIIAIEQADGVEIYLGGLDHAGNETCVIAEGEYAARIAAALKSRGDLP